MPQHGLFWGPKKGQKWVKNSFFQSHPEPFGVLKQVFFEHFEYVVMRFGPYKISKCLENGPFFGPKKGVNGSKNHFQKGIMSDSGCSKKCFLRALGTW